MKRKVLVKLIAKTATLEMKVQRLEQAIQDIWGSCSCLRKDLDVDDVDISSCEPPEDDLTEEPEDLCGGYFNCEPLEDDPFEEEPKEIGHD